MLILSLPLPLPLRHLLVRFLLQVATLTEEGFLDMIRASSANLSSRGADSPSTSTLQSEPTKDRKIPSSKAAAVSVSVYHPASAYPPKSCSSGSSSSSSSSSSKSKSIKVFNLRYQHDITQCTGQSASDLHWLFRSQIRLQFPHIQVLVSPVSGWLVG